MTRLLTFLQDYRAGILVFFLSLAGIAFLVQWFAWIFAKGRFSATTPSSSGRAELRYLFSEATVKIINDFRHLLALIIVLIFAVALGYSLWKAASVQTGSIVDNMKEALQAVVATLGGLVGSIIGYYFGESSVAKVTETRTLSQPTPDNQPIQEANPPV